MGNNCCKLCNIRLVVFFCLFLLSGCAIPIFKRDGSYVVQAEELRIFPRIFPFFEGPMDFIIIGTNTPVVIGFDLGCGSSLCFNCDENHMRNILNLSQVRMRSVSEEKDKSEFHLPHFRVFRVFRGLKL